MRWSWRRDLIYDFLAPPLILTTPFASFVNYNDYSFARMEVWLVLGGLIALGLLCGVVMTLGGLWARIILTAGLVTLFVDFQFDWLDKQAEFAFRLSVSACASELAFARATESDHDPRFRNDAGSDFGPSWSFGELSFGHPGSAWSSDEAESAAPVVVHLFWTSSSAWQASLR